jgi:hypothetical protein
MSDNTKQEIIINVNINDRFRINDIFEDEINYRISHIFEDEDPQTEFINESGFYSLIFESKKDEAQEFKKWVTSEVLPSIRKNGSYNIFNNYSWSEDDLDKYYKKDCVFLRIIHIIDKIYSWRYGRSSSISKRLQTHKNILNYTKIIKIYEMKNINQIIELEKKIKKFVHSLDINRVLCNELSLDNQVEIFEIEDNNLYNLIEKIDEFSIEI